MAEEDRQAALVKEVTDRPHWRMWGDIAVYAPPGTDAQVHIRAATGSRPRDWYFGVLKVGDRAERSSPHGTARGARQWAERMLPPP